MQCIGLDLGAKYSVATLLTEDGGEVEAEARIRTTRAGLRRFFDMPPAHVCMEVGSTSPWVDRLLRELGHDVITCNPRHLKIIAESTLKTDRLDSEVLARLGRLAQMDPRLLRRVQHRSAETQRQQAMLRVRGCLVASRTKCVNAARGLARTLGHPLPSCASALLPERVRGSSVPQEVKALLEPLLETVAQLNAQVDRLDEHVLELGKDSEVIRRFQAIPGIGPLTALAFVLCIESPERFRRARDVGPFLGLRPTLRQSGDGLRRGRITRTGDPAMRCLLTQAAHALLRSKRDTDLTRWARGLLARIGRRKAVPAVARKLAVLMLRLWQTGEPYQPHHLETKAA